MASDLPNTDVNAEAAIHVESGDQTATVNAVLVSGDDDGSDDVAGVMSVPAVAIVSNEDDEIPLATVEPVPLAQSEEPGVGRQPAIISVMVLKSNMSDLGLCFEEAAEGLRISRIDPEGLFSETPLAMGDYILSVNNFTCEQKDVAYIWRMIRRGTRTVTLVVHRPDGDPYLISSTVSKPSPESKVGIGVQIFDGALRVSSIDPSGLFADGILDVGDKVVSIGGISCTCMDSASSVELIRQEEHTVTIVAWTEEEAGVVVAAAKTTPLYVRYRSFLPCLFSVFLITIIAVIVILTSQRDMSTSGSDDEKDHECRNLYGKPIPLC